MGTRFFRIVGISSYLVAALALLVTVFMLLGFGGAWLPGGNSKVDYPAPSFQDFVEHVKPVTPAQQAPQHAPHKNDTAETTVSSTEEITGYKQHVLALAEAADEYAELTRQNSVNRDGLIEWFDGVSSQLQGDDDIRLAGDMNKAFRQQLLTPAQKGNSSILANSIPGLKQGDSEYVTWPEWLGWYMETWLNDYQQELQRIEAEQVAKAEARSESFSLLVIAGAAFMVFFLATLVLLLVKIEANTRPAINRD